MTHFKKFREKIGLSSWLAILLCITGAGLIFHDGISLSLWGAVAGLLAAGARGVAIHMIKISGEKNHPVVVYYSVCLFGLLLFPFVINEFINIKDPVTIAILFLILTVVGIYYLNKKQLVDRSIFINAFNRLSAHIDTLSTPLRTEDWKASLFFGAENSDYLIKEFRTIRSVRSPEKMSEALISELLNGPEAKGVRTIPEQTRLLAVDLKKNGLFK